MLQCARFALAYASQISAANYSARVAKVTAAAVSRSRASAGREKCTERSDRNHQPRSARRHGHHARIQRQQHPAAEPRAAAHDAAQRRVAEIIVVDDARLMPARRSLAIPESSCSNPADASGPTVRNVGPPRGRRDPVVRRCRRCRPRGRRAGAGRGTASDRRRGDFRQL